MLLLPGKQVPKTQIKMAEVSGRTERTQQLRCPFYHKLTIGASNGKLTFTGGDGRDGVEGFIW